MLHRDGLIACVLMIATGEEMQLKTSVDNS